MKVIRKLFQTKATSIDEEAKSVTFTISTNGKDRYGDIVDQKSWDFKSYLSNPIVLWGHDPGEPENVLGTASDLMIAGDGSETTAKLSFDTDINPKAGLVFDQIRRGTLRTVSVGFINHSLEYDDDDPILKDNELMEISVVPIPANAGALAKELKAGHMNVKDARWLVDSITKEAELINEQIAAEKGDKEVRKSMTEEQAAKLIESVEAMSAKVEAQAEVITELKADRDARVEAEAKAAQEAADAKKLEEEEAAKAAAKQDPAKSGDNDQDGAGEDELGEDAELTPEEEAELDTAFAQLLEQEKLEEVAAA